VTATAQLGNQPIAATLFDHSRAEHRLAWVERRREVNAVKQRCIDALLQVEPVMNVT
jgi:hypothetical protein